MSFELPIGKGLGIDTYNAPCLIFFAVTGLILQVPVIYTHCGLFSRTNVPVILLSLCYIYVMFSYIMAATHWNGEGVEKWWHGAGWCDIDVRLQMMSSLTILCAQAAINWNIVELLGSRPRLIFGAAAWRRGAVELIGCLALPIINVAVSTFFMRQRYSIYQGLGCSAVTDTSAALIVTYVMWLPILGVGVLVTMILIAFRFWKRGRAQAMETVSCIPHMNSAQFCRLVLFSLIVTFVFVPIIITVAIMNFIAISREDSYGIAWIHGKPNDWSVIMVVTLQQLGIVADGLQRGQIILMFIIRYVNISIAWLLFICYGTGSLATEAYKRAIFTVMPWLLPKNYDSNNSSDMESTRMGYIHKRNQSELSLESNGREWEPDFDGAKALKDWEHGYKSRHDVSQLNSKAFDDELLPTISSETTSCSSDPSDPELPENTEDRRTHRPKLAMRELLGGNNAFSFKSLHKQYK